MAKHKVLTTDKEIENALVTSASVAPEPRVSEVELITDKDEKLLSLRMSDGSRHDVPVSKLQGISDLDSHCITNFEVSEDGLGIYWPDVDVDFYVPALLQGIYGTKQWMSSLGRLGGKSTSAAKCRAARANGRKGGRPRKLVAGPNSTTPTRHLSEEHEGILLHSEARWQLRGICHTRAEFAVLFGLDPESFPRPLPRIA